MTPPVVARVPEPAPPAPPPRSARERLADVHNEQSERLEHDGQLRQARDERKIALTINPGDAKAAEAVKRLDSAIERAVAARIEEGRAALTRGSHIEARRRFLAALALDPLNRPAFEALQQDVRDVESLNHTVRAGETLASLAQRYYGDSGRGEVIAESNQLGPGARLTAGKVLKIPEIPGLPFPRPEPPRPQVARPAAARPEPAAAAPAAPKDDVPEVNPLLVEAQEAFARNDLSVALTDLDKLLASQPGNPEGLALKKQVLYCQGKSQFDAQRYMESYKTLTQLAAIAPDYENSEALLKQSRQRLVDQHYAQGIRLYREEKPKEAIAEWRIVLELDPQHANARRSIEQAERLLKGLEERRRK
jgi:tetratricopeptide (TPR) repeat protein